MVSPEQFVTLWHRTIFAGLDAEEENIWRVPPLVSFDETVVASLPLPETSRRFLTEAGLPTHAFSGWRFGYPSDAMPPLPQAIAGWTYPADYARYRMLGVDEQRTDSKKPSGIFYSVICLDLETNGQVVNVMTLPDYPVKFLNSSISQFAEFILLWNQKIEWRTAHKLRWGLDDYEVWEQERVAYNLKMAEQMRRIDPPTWQAGLLWYERITNPLG